MKKAKRVILSALLFGGLLLLTLRAGTGILLYPFARAFGSPPESELADCRRAFQQLQAHLGTSRVLVLPVLFVNGHQRDWRNDLAEAIVQEVGTYSSAKLDLADAPPGVAQPKLGRNQLRYLWERGAAYSRWVKQAHPADHYVLCTEIWGQHGKVAAIHIYILDSSGQIAYCHLYNSHQFGENLPLEGNLAVLLLVRRFFEHLLLEPTRIFPPYGVG
jgi:hypothetical protein